MTTFQPEEIILNGTYKIEKQIGEGAFGAVYLATYLQLGIQRAIKVVVQGDGLGSTLFEQYRGRFKLEAKLGASFHHSNIIHVNQFEEENGELFLIMDYAPGGSLADQIEKAQESGSPISIDQALKWISEAASGLAKLHERDMVHRDIKPSNLLIDSENHACIADLGLVQLPTSRLEGSSMGMNHPGTPEYMPPEQRPGNFMPLRASADIYALGCVLFELLTGRQYYHRAEGTSAKSLRAEIPDWLDQIVGKCLQPDSKSRFADAGEMLKALENRSIEKNQKSEKNVTPPPFVIEKPVPVPVPPPPVDNFGKTPLPPAPPQKSSPILWIGLAALAFSLVTFIILISSKGGGPGIATLTATSWYGNTVDVVAPTSTPQVASYIADSGPVRLAMMVGAVGDTDIYVSNEDGSGLKCVACDRSCDEAEPSWSPDGENIVYQSNCNGTYDLWVVSRSGGSASRLTTDGSSDEREPDWGSNNKIVYRVSDEGANRDDNGDLYVLDYSSGSSSPLGVQGRSPAWSPDGSKLAFMSNETGIWQIYEMDISTSHIDQITNCSVNCRWPNWSPDGNYIVYNKTTSASSSTADGVAYISAYGGSENMLVSGYAGRPSWSSNGLISFNTDKGIEVINFNTKNRSVLVSDSSAWGPIWSK